MGAFNEYTTVTGRKIKVRSNQSKRTYTIVTDGSVYRTLPMSKEEFQSCQHNTGNDWNQFLKSNDYYKVR